MTIAQPRRLLILGGSLHHRGGLEAFCARAAEAVNADGGGWSAHWQTTDNAYLSPRRWPRALRRLIQGYQSAACHDAVWLQWSTLADLLFVIVVRLRGVPLIVTPHLGGNARLQRVAALRWTCRMLLRGADGIGLLFDAQGEEVALPDDVTRTTLGSFLPAAALADRPVPERSGPLRIVHAGRLSEAKGTFRTIALCAALRDRGVSAVATIIGRTDADTSARLRRAVDQAGLGDVVTFVDWLAEDALIEILREADVLAHLSLIDSYPLVVLEAMAQGAVPIVADMRGAASMVARYGGYVAPEPMVERAADWLAQRSAAGLRTTAGGMARAVRADFAWSIGSRRVLDAVESAVERRRGAARGARG